MFHYKPCRKTELFKIENNHAIIMGMNSIIQLNSVATLLWKMADGTKTIGEMIDEMVLIFRDVDKGIIEKDIIDLIQDLHKKGIMIINWDPLYKHLANQQFEGSGHFA